MRGIAALACALGTTAHATGATPLAPAAALSVAATGHYVTPVLVNGSGPHSFVVDTGAESCAVYPHFAERQGLERTGEDTLVGQTGAAAIELARVDSLVTAGVSAGPLSCAVLPPRQDGALLDGIVGLDSMRQHAVLFDPAAASLAFYPPGVAPADCLGPDYVAVKARQIDGGLLAFDVAINGAPGIAVLDSGARRTVINTGFARSAGIDLASLALDAPLHGAAGLRQELRKGRLGSIEIAGRTYADFHGSVADLAVFDAFGVAQQPAMILGLDFIASGAMLVDFPAQMVFIRRPE